MLSTIGQARVASVPASGEANDAQKILEEVDRAIQAEGWHFNIFYDVDLEIGTAVLGCAIPGQPATTVNTTSAHYLIKGENIAIDSITNTVATVTDADTFEANVATSGTVLRYSKRIETPTTALNVDFSTYRYGSLDPVVRGQFIYDKNNATYEFSEDLKAIITYQVPFEQATAGGEALPEYARRYITMKAARIFAQRHVGDPQLIQYAARDEMEAHAQFLQAEAENAETNAFNAALPYYTVTRGQSVQIPAISNLYKV